MLASGKFDSLCSEDAADLRVLFRIGAVPLSVPADVVAGLYQVGRHELFRSGENLPRGCIGFIDLATPVEVFDVAAVLRIEPVTADAPVVLVIDSPVDGWWGLLADRIDRVVAARRMESWPIPLLWQLHGTVPFDRIEQFDGQLHCCCNTQQLLAMVKGEP